jgi:hypothetical protein
MLETFQSAVCIKTECRCDEETSFFRECFWFNTLVVLDWKLLKLETELLSRFFGFEKCSK